MPAQWYFVNYTFGLYQDAMNTTMMFIFLDTNQLRSNCSAINPQLIWLENLLSNSPAEWLFVLGHHAIYSLGSHGPDSCLQQYLEPLLYKYNVSAYFNGHDHRLQHFVANNPAGTIDKGLGPAVNYYGTGAGHGIDSPVNFSTLSPSDYQVYIPSFTAKQFLWPANFSDYTAAELEPNQDTTIRTIPDSGADRGGFMSIELSRECICTQWYSSKNEFLYSSSSPNARINWTVSSDDCVSRCSQFLPTEEESHWYDNAGALAGVVIAGIFILFLILVLLFRMQNRVRPLDSGLRPGGYQPLPPGTNVQD